MSQNSLKLLKFEYFFVFFSSWDNKLNIFGLWTTKTFEDINLGLGKFKSTFFHHFLTFFSSSTGRTPPRRTETETRLWTWWRTGTPTSRTCWEETPRCWTPPKKAAWPGCRSYVAPTTSTVGIRRDATQHHCTSQVTHTYTLSHVIFSTHPIEFFADTLKPRIKPEVFSYRLAEVCEI